jgi:serine/threonine protein kinase
MQICPHCEQHTEMETCPHDGSETVSLASWTPELADARLGAVLDDRYRIEERIGVGAMGRVYRATDTRVARKVAVKVLRAELAGDAEAQARFRQEVSVLARLHHRHIVHLYDHGLTEDGALFLVMELLSGRSLASVVREDAPLDPRRVVSMAQAVLEALVEAHAEGVVHRDLKPENLFLHAKRRTGEIVKVLDFGIAKILGTTTVDGLPLTHRGVVLGTPNYLSPEQLRGQAVTPKSDLYAFGAIVYELLTGHRPFDHLPASEVARAHVEVPAPPPEVKGRRLEGPLVDLIMACLAKDPSDRPPSAEEALITLEGFEDRPLRALKRRETVPSFPVVSDAKVADAAPKPRTGRRVLVPTTPRERKSAEPAPAPVSTSRSAKRRVSVAEMDAVAAREAASEARVAPPFESMQTGRSVSTQFRPEPARRPRTGLAVGGLFALAAGLVLAFVLWPADPESEAVERVVNLPASAEHASVVRAVAETAPTIEPAPAVTATAAPQKEGVAAPTVATAAQKADGLGEIAPQAGVGALTGVALGAPLDPSSAAADPAVAPAVAPATALPTEGAGDADPESPAIAAPNGGVEAAPARPARPAEVVAAPAPAIAETCRTELVTDPAGAAVYVDGRRIGQTPMFVEWPVGAQAPTVELVSGGRREKVTLSESDAGRARTIALTPPPAPEPAPVVAPEPPAAAKARLKTTKPARKTPTPKVAPKPAPAKKAGETGAGAWGPVD